MNTVANTYKTTNGAGFCCDNSSPQLKSIPVDNVDYEKLQYYYHSDHLGSASYITNLDGEVVQHVEYVPLGEVFIEEHNNTWNTPYLFNGKELDEETGLYYYGARYYNPRTSLWLSVDPLMEDYVGLSVYGYCGGNPIVYRDENGEWINFVVGAVVGAATDYAVQVVTNIVENGGEITMDAFTDVDATSIALSAGAGAMGVGIANGVSKLTKVAKVAQVAAKSKTAAKVIQGTANVAGDAVSSVAGSAIQGNEITVEGVVSDVVAGAVGRKVGSSVTNKAKPNQKVLDNAADRTKRIANNSVRPARQANADKAAQAAKSYKNMTKVKAAVASGVSSNAVSKSINVVVNATKENTETQK